MNIKKILLAVLIASELLIHLFLLLQFEQEQFFFEATLLVVLFMIAFMGVFYVRSKDEDLPLFSVFFGMNAFNMLIFERLWVGSLSLEVVSYSTSLLGILIVYSLHAAASKETKIE